MSLFESKAPVQAVDEFTRAKTGLTPEMLGSSFSTITDYANNLVKRGTEYGFLVESLGYKTVEGMLIPKSKVGINTCRPIMPLIAIRFIGTRVQVEQFDDEIFVNLWPKHMRSKLCSSIVLSSVGVEATDMQTSERRLPSPRKLEAFREV